MKWHVCTTGINQEFIALHKLLADNFEAYLPTGKRQVRHARQEKIRIFPVFSRYIFVRFDAGEPGFITKVRCTDGILDILANNSRPVMVPEWAIDDIRQREAKGEFNIIPKKKKPVRWSHGFEILKNLLNVGSPNQV